MPPLKQCAGFFFTKEIEKRPPSPPSKASSSHGKTTSQWPAESEWSLPPSSQATIQSYKTWLTSFDGGRRTVATANQSVQQLTSILESVHATVDDFVEKKDLLRDSWLMKKMDMSKPGTTYSYLCSLKNFSVFMQRNGLGETDIYKFSRFEQTCSTWLKSLKTDIRKRRQEVLSRDSEDQITPAMISKFENSSVALKAIALFDQASDAQNVNMSLSKTDYQLVRNYLILECLVNNGQRSGVISNVTLRDFRRASKTLDKDGVLMYVTVRVSNHKTSQKGPARLVLNRGLWWRFRVFIDKFRRPCSSEELFTTYDGLPLKSCEIHKCTNRIWKEAGLEKKLNPTVLRKACVSRIYEERPDMTGMIHNALCHSQQTGQSYYQLHLNDQRQQTVSQSLSKVMRVENDSPCTQAEESARTHDYFDSTDTMAYVNDVKVPDCAKDSSTQECDNSQQDNFPNETKASTLKSPHGRRHFSDDSAFALKQHFSKYIDLNCVPTSPQIRCEMELKPELWEKLPPGTTVKQISERLRVYIRKKLFDGNKNDTSDCSSN